MQSIKVWSQGAAYGCEETGCVEAVGAQFVWSGGRESKGDQYKGARKGVTGQGKGGDGVENAAIMGCERGGQANKTYDDIHNMI